MRMINQRDRRHSTFFVVVVLLLLTGYLIMEDQNKFIFTTVYNFTEIGVPAETYTFFQKEQLRWDVGKSPQYIKQPETVTMPNGRPISLLKPSKTYIVPNIVHFMWFGKGHKWKFYEMLSIMSTYLFVKPDAIYFHCDYEPVGYWWDYVKRKVHTLKIVAAVPPKYILGRRIVRPNHYTDIYRMFLMYNIGGIYFDNDILGLKPFHDLRVYNVTLGLEYHPIRGSVGRVNTGIIVAAKHSQFLNVWWNTYKNFSSINEHDYHPCIIPYTLIQQHPHLVHIEEKTLNYPSGPDNHLLYDTLIDYRQSYAMHMWYEDKKSSYNPENIKKLNTTFARIARSIYYNTTDFVD